MSKVNISRLEKGERNITDRTIADICREFNVNEEWLRTGEGEIFIEQSTENLDLIAEEYKLSDLSKSVMAKFLAMDGENRDTILNFVKDLFIDSPTSNSVEDETEIRKQIRSNLNQYDYVNLDKEKDNKKNDVI